MPGRKYEPAGGYRYGFNGKEKDKDIGAESQDYGMRINDSRLARFLSVDPIASAYPWYTPYQFAGNSPIAAIDLDGEEPKWMIDDNGRLTTPMIKLLTAGLGYKERRMTHVLWHKTKTHYFANTLVAKIGYNPRITESQIADTEEYLSLWFTLIAHEGRHRNEYPVIAWPVWGASYLTKDVIPTTLKLQEYRDGYWESRAYSNDWTEGLILNLVNYSNGLILKTLASEYSDEIKSNIIQFAVAAYKYEEAAEKNDKKTGLMKWLGSFKVSALRKKMDKAANSVDTNALDDLNKREKRSIRMPEDGGVNPDGTKRPNRYKSIRDTIKGEKKNKKKNGENKS